jgi:hypothetical protein
VTSDPLLPPAPLQPRDATPRLKCRPTGGFDLATPGCAVKPRLHWLRREHHDEYRVLNSPLRTHGMILLGERIAAEILVQSDGTLVKRTARVCEHRKREPTGLRAPDSRDGRVLNPAPHLRRQHNVRYSRRVDVATLRACRCHRDFHSGSRNERLAWQWITFLLYQWHAGGIGREAEDCNFRIVTARACDLPGTLALSLPIWRADFDLLAVLDSRDTVACVRKPLAVKAIATGCAVRVDIQDTARVHDGSIDRCRSVFPAKRALPNLSGGDGRPEHADHHDCTNGKTSDRIRRARHRILHPDSTSKFDAITFERALEFQLSREEDKGLVAEDLRHRVKMRNVCSSR